VLIKSKTTLYQLYNKSIPTLRERGGWLRVGRGKVWGRKGGDREGIGGSKEVIGRGPSKSSLKEDFMSEGLERG
jgi:hypothetical protein